MQILIRCNKPSDLASQIFEQEHVVEAQIHKDGRGLLVRTRDADSFYLMLNQHRHERSRHRIGGPRRRRRELSCTNT